MFHFSSISFPLKRVYISSANNTTTTKEYYTQDGDNNNAHNTNNNNSSIEIIIIKWQKARRKPGRSWSAWSQL
jgi:hypothetical protein